MIACYMVGKTKEKQQHGILVRGTSWITPILLMHDIK
jgi:hypothetical protein